MADGESRALAYLPRLAVEQLIAGVDGPTPMTGALLFADVSGFSRIAVVLAERGHQGAEILTELLNACFGRLIEVLEGYGGQVLDFVGDAVLALWPGAALPRAIVAALAIQAEVDGRFGLDDLSLRLRVGLAGGELILQHVGTDRRRHFIATGDVIRRVGRACARAERGSVVLDHAGFEVPGQLRIEPLESTLVRIVETDGTWPDPTRPSPCEPGSAVLARLAGYVPEPVRARRRPGDTSKLDLRGWTSELREVSVLFVGVEDRRRAIPTPEAIAELVEDIDDALAELQGNLEQVVMDDKGLVMVAAFGLPPRSHEDDPARAVRAGLSILEIGREAGLALSLGITTGRVFCGVWGHPSRLHYTMVGAAMNWAARLMQAGQGDGAGILVDRETSARAGRRFEFEPLPAIEVKGSEVPLEVARPRASTGASTSGSFAARSLIGRVDELAQIEAELDRMRAGEGPAVVIVGEAGIGKSRLLRSALASAQRRGLVARVGAGDMIDASAAFAAWRPIFAELIGFGEEPWPVPPPAALRRGPPPPARYRGAAVHAAIRHRTDVDWLQRELGEIDEVRRLFPLLAAVVPIELPDNAQTAAMDPQLRRETTRSVLAAVLAARLRPGRDLIVIEDAHWLDSASWALLDALRRVCPEIGVLVTMRPLELERGELSPIDLERLRAGEGPAVVIVG
ncbi:MAG TPA: AAA family ATPase, partial [Enhygromyxa sp.]|nr:AAA family ATPase [Enhygromyxa sp.]